MKVVNSRTVQENTPSVISFTLWRMNLCSRGTVLSFKIWSLDEKVTVGSFPGILTGRNTNIMNQWQIQIILLSTGYTHDRNNRNTVKKGIYS